MIDGAERTRWKIRGERMVDANPRFRLSVTTLELPDGTVFDQYVVRMPRCAMTVVLDEAAERMLLIGYRPRSIEPVLEFQPMAGSADSAHELYLARGADRIGAPLADEAEPVRWIPLAELPGLIATGQITGAATIIGAQHALLTAGQPPR